MLVSIILISYNQGAYVREAIESVFAQTYSDWELIIIDNGSTDGSHRVLAEYTTDSRVRLIRFEENGSISHRFNQGLDASSGEFISFLYSDDRYLPNKLARQVELFSNATDDYGVVYCPAWRFDTRNGQRWFEASVPATGFILHELLADGLRVGTINMVSPLLRRRCHEKYRFYDDLFAEGESYFYRLAMTERFLYDAEPLVMLREHESNLGKATKFNVDTLRVVCQRLGESADFPADCRDDLREFEAVLLRNGGWCVLRMGGDVEWARNAIFRSIEISPRSALNPRAAGGLILSYLPPSIRAFANAVGHFIRRSPAIKVNVEMNRPI